MEPTCTVSSPVDAPARLSYAQKRDLLGQAVAAVLTTALIAAPLITPTDSGDARPLASLPAASFAAPVAAVAIGDAVPLTAQRERGWTGAARMRARHRSTRADSVTVGAAGMQPPQEVQTAAYATPRKPLSRRLTGWLTGNGAHSVRPFPTVAVPQP